MNGIIKRWLCGVLWSLATLLLFAALVRRFMDDGPSVSTGIGLLVLCFLSTVTYFNYFVGMNKQHIAHALMIAIFFTYAVCSAAYEFNLIDIALTQAILVILAVVGVCIVAKYWRSIYRRYL